MTDKPVIAIDGPAASGKGTLSKRLAEKLGFAHMDTGALYRATAYEVIQAGGNPENEQDALRGAASLKTKIETALSNPALREERTGDAAAKVAAIQSVRDALLHLQHSFAKQQDTPYKGAVLDGRDIGTVICPNANVKLFVTASVEIRAQRRLKELQSVNKVVTYEAVLKDMQERDTRDSSRKSAPLKPADDAATIDTSDMNADEAFDHALRIVQGKLPQLVQKLT